MIIDPPSEFGTLDQWRQFRIDMEELIKEVPEGPLVREWLSRAQAKEAELSA